MYNYWKQFIFITPDYNEEAFQNNSSKFIKDMMGDQWTINTLSPIY